MSYRVEITSFFKKQAKPLLKKYPSLKGELENVIDILEQDPNQGTSIGNNCYKIRLAIASKNKGKSGGARLIVNVQFIDHLVYMLSIYDKAEQENISDAEIKALLKFIP